MNSPPGHWLFGHTPAMRSNPIALLDACQPPTARLWLGRRAWLLLEPSDVDHVLRDSGVYGKGRAFRFGRRLYGNSLLVSEGEEHARQARQIGNLFQQHAPRTFLGPTAAVALCYARRWQVGEEIDLWSAMLQLIQALSSQAVFGHDWLPAWMLPGGGEEIGSVLVAINAAMDHVAQQNFSLLSLPDWLPTSANRRYREAVTWLDQAVTQAVGRRKRGEAGGDFLDVLLKARDENNQPLPASQVRDQALTLMLGGYESLAASLCWTLLLLWRHPDVRRRLLDEVRGTIGDRLPTVEDAGRLPYTSQVFSESLRLYPPQWLISRTVQRKDSLPSGLRLRAGALVYLSPYRTQRDERFFPEPLRFDPSRFAERKKGTWPAGAYFPFGGGPRDCLGEGIARTQAVLILATLCRGWNFEVEGKALPTPRPVLTLRPPVPLMVRLVPAEGGDVGKNEKKYPAGGTPSLSPNQ